MAKRGRPRIEKKYSFDAKGIVKDLGVKKVDITFKCEAITADFLEQVKNIAKAKISSNGSVILGNLQKAIAVKTYPSETGVWGGVGIDRKVKGKTKRIKDRKTKQMKNFTPKPVSYAHLVERGFTHAPDGTKINGKPFLKPAYEMAGGNSAYAEALKRGINEVLEKNGV